MHKHILVVYLFCVTSVVTDLPSPGSITAVGDLHGDLLLAAATLHLAGIVDTDGQWQAGATTVVQLGDVVDRGPDSLAIYRWFDVLQTQAEKRGGHFVRLLGNHELMNFQGDYRFVSEEDVANAGGASQRAQLWDENGVLGGRLRQLNITALLGDTVFVHAGLLPGFSLRGLHTINEAAHTALRRRNWRHPLFTDNGPVWTREVIFTAQAGKCGLTRASLAALSRAEGRPITRMVVGHTPQMTRHVESYCNGALWAVDIGISRWVAGSVGALRILPDGKPEVIQPSQWFSLKPAEIIVRAVQKFQLNHTVTLRKKPTVVFLKNTAGGVTSLQRSRTEFGLDRVPMPSVAVELLISDIASGLSRTTERRPSTLPRGVILLILVLALCTILVKRWNRRLRRTETTVRRNGSSGPGFL